MTLTVNYPTRVLAALLPRLTAALDVVPFFDTTLDLWTYEDGDDFFIDLTAPRPAGGERSYQVALEESGVTVHASYQTPEEGKKTHHRKWSEQTPDDTVVVEVCADAVNYFMRDHTP